MAPKTRRQEDENLPTAKAQRGGNDRAERLTLCLAALNGQFASWVATHKEANLHRFWIEGVCDYLNHATKLLEEYKDILPSDGVSTLQQAAAAADERLSALSGRPALTGTAPPPAATAGFGALASSQPSSGNKAAAPALGFMAAPAFNTTAPVTTGTTFGFGAAASKPAATEGTAPAAAGFAFGASAASTTAASGKEGAAAPGPFAFSASGKEGAAAKEGNGGSTAPAAPGGLFSFGAAAAAAASKPSTAGGDAAPATAAATSSKPFTFGVSSSSGTDAGANGSGAAATTSTTAPAATGFKFGGAAAASSAATSGSAALAGSIFGSASGGASGAAASTAPAFSFGVAPSTAPAAAADKGAAGTGPASASTAAPGGFFFGGSGAATGATGFGGFGAPGAAPAFAFGTAPATAAAGGGEGEEDGEAEPEPDECAKEPSLQVDENVDFLFKEKARLQVPVKAPDGKISGWEVKGMGLLSVRRGKAEGSKPYIALFTESGRCLYQAYFNKTMKLVVSDKQKSVAFTAAWSPDGTSPPALNPALFQLAAGKNHMFEQVVTKLQSEMTD